MHAAAWSHSTSHPSFCAAAPKLASGCLQLLFFVALGWLASCNKPERNAEAAACQQSAAQRSCSGACWWFPDPALWRGPSASLLQRDVQSAGTTDYLVRLLWEGPARRVTQAAVQAVGNLAADNPGLQGVLREAGADCLASCPAWLLMLAHLCLTSSA